jgi:phospholipid/cholesterol/gamma-HCH transport system substrate-binding protein
MGSKVNYTAVGLFVIGLIAAVIYLVLWLSAGLPTHDYKTYVTYMQESVSGLSEQAPVRFNGVNIGYVDEIDLSRTDPNQVRLLLKIEEDIPIRIDTTSTLKVQGLTGIAYIDLRGGKANAPLLQKLPGETYPIIRTRPSLFQNIENTIGEIAENFDVITDGVRDLLSTQNQIKIQNILSNLEQVTNVFADNKSRIDQVIKDMQTIAQNTSQASKDFPELSRKLTLMASELEAAGIEMGQFMQKGRITIDTITPQLHLTLRNISKLSQNLNQLSKDLEQHPSVLFRGKNPPQPGPGETSQ